MLQCVAVCCSELSDTSRLATQFTVYSESVYTQFTEATNSLYTLTVATLSSLYTVNLCIQCIEWRVEAVCCSVLQCVAVCCSVLQCVAVGKRDLCFKGVYSELSGELRSVLHCIHKFTVYSEFSVHKFTVYSVLSIHKFT